MLYLHVAVSLAHGLCPCVTGLFIDVGTNYSVLDHTNLSFIYEDVLSPGPNSDGEFVCISLLYSSTYILQSAGQNLEAETEAEARDMRPRPRPSPGL